MKEVKTMEELKEQYPRGYHSSVDGGAPTIRCLWPGSAVPYLGRYPETAEVRDIRLVYVPESSFLGADVVLGNTDGYDDWGHIIVEDHGFLNGEEYFFVATESW